MIRARGLYRLREQVGLTPCSLSAESGGKNRPWRIMKCASTSSKIAILFDESFVVRYTTTMAKWYYQLGII
jgi:hypothetical protein